MDVINGVRSIYGIEKLLRYKNVHQLANIDFMVSMLLTWCNPNFYLKYNDQVDPAKFSKLFLKMNA